MGNIYLVSLRLAVALVCVGASIIMGGQWLGLIPDVDRLNIRARAARCEAVAIQSAMLIRSDKLPELEAVLRTISQRDKEIESIGLRKFDGALAVDTGDHQLAWDAVKAKRGVDAIHVPLTVGGKDW